jgi:putative ABC transport system ATP-binding protein
MDHMSSKLAVMELNKTYGSGVLAVHAVRNVSFEAQAGQLTAILGPSGSGKTTLLGMIGGLLTPTSGKVVAAGRDIVGLSDAERQKYRRDHVGFIFQANNLIPFLTARDNVLLVKEIGSGDLRNIVDRANKLLDELGLTSRANALATELSAGERQRVAIARALVKDADIVLADEPTANLDSELGQRVVESLVAGIKVRSKVGIMVTHDLRMVALSDVVLEMRDGQLLQSSRRRD